MKVSRKFSKKAVIRNKAKRRIRHLTQLLVKNPDIIYYESGKSQS
jgi:ribonuclease P protein component